MSHNNLVNMDTRTVVSGIPYGNFDEDQINLFDFFDSKTSENTIEKKFLMSTLLTKHALHTFDDIINYVTKQKCKYELEIESIPLSALEDWVIEEGSIHHKDHKYFNIIAVEVSIENREVVKWTQPMVEPAQEGLCAFVCKEINGVLHFVVQTKLECGNFDILELSLIHI